MIESILPGTIKSSESFGDPPDIPPLPEEEPLVRNATSSRRAEFAAARACARNALAQLELPTGPILRHPGGAPRWPAGVIGSITHCAGYQAAVAGQAVRGVAAVGIDAEPHRPLRSGLLDLISTPQERSGLDSARRAVRSAYLDTVLFSAKESTYKAWFSLTGSYLDFSEMLITFHLKSFDIRLRDQAGSPSSVWKSMSGSWMISNGLILTAVTAWAPPVRPAHHAHQRRHQQ